MTRRRFSLAAVVVAAALASVGALTTGAASGKSARAAATPIKFQLSFFLNAQHVGYLVASRRGYYSRAGLSVKMIPGGPTLDPPLVLAQGNVDIAQVDFAEFVQAVAKGAPMTFVALTYQRDPLSFVALKKTPLSKPADLKGKNVGVQQTGPPAAELQALLGQGGLTLDDIKLVPISFTIDDLLNGKCDVFPSQFFFHPAQFKDKGLPFNATGLNILDPNKYGAAVAAQGIAVNNNFLKKHPDAVVKFLKASLQGWNYSVAHPRLVLKDVESFIPAGASNPKDDAVDIAATITLATKNPQGVKVRLLQLPLPYLRQSQATLLKYHIIDKAIDLSKTVTSKYIDQARALLAQKK